MNSANKLSSMHIMTGNHVNVVYDEYSMNLFKVSNRTYEIIKALKNGVSLTNISEKHQCSEIQISKLLESLQGKRATSQTTSVKNY